MCPPPPPSLFWHHESVPAGPQVPAPVFPVFPVSAGTKVTQINIWMKSLVHPNKHLCPMKRQDLVTSSRWRRSVVITLSLVLPLFLFFFGVKVPQVASRILNRPHEPEAVLSVCYTEQQVLQLQRNKQKSVWSYITHFSVPEFVVDHFIPRYQF